MPRYSTILFDLDGTLTDPGVGITRSVQYALAKFGINEPVERLRSFIGPPLHANFQQVYQFSLEQAHQAVAYYREYFTKTGMYENVVYPGIPELLARLKEDDGTLLVATSKPTVFAAQILEYFQLDKFFNHTIGSNLDGTRSNKAEVIAYALKQCEDIEQSSTVMVGDREHDIIGAHANGIASIGVAYGYGSKQELRQAGSTFLADNVEQLSELLG